MTLRAKSLATVVFVSAALALASCGGSGGGSSTPPVVVSPPPPPPPPPTTTWTQGQFSPKSTFEAKCITVRSGSSPITGNPYPDTAGNEAEEKFWVRSWNNETYLWYDEVTDVDPNGVSGVLPYFNTQRTTAQTPSGKDKDDFHFSEPTTDYEMSFSSGASFGYGMRFTIDNDNNNFTQVVYTEPNSPATTGTALLSRGAQIIGVDGVTLASLSSQADVDTANGALYPNASGETHNFTVRDFGAATDRTFSMVSGSIDRAAVNRFSTIDTPTGKVGYMLFNTFSPTSAEGQLFDAFTSLKADGITDFILDLRYNGGGRVDIASELGFMIAGSAQTSGKTFIQFRENDKQPVDQPFPFLSRTQGLSGPADNTALPSLDLPRVFILTTGGSCSASELVPNALRGADVEVIIIGDRTCGKPYGFLPTDNCGTTFYTIQFQGVNDKGFGDYADGFVPANGTSSGGPGGVTVPGCAVADDFTEQLGDPDENLLEAALAYRADGMCPAALLSKTDSSAAAKAYANETMPIGQSERILNQERVRNAMTIDPSMLLNK